MTEHGPTGVVVVEEMVRRADDWIFILAQFYRILTMRGKMLMNNVKQSLSKLSV
jgi:hypothetical protein